ncbi:hypothetical protein HMN09_00995100 [Mycena chlorophos]|uniref:Uncharacterized protein n=1 Tax=Mycena chlorophos TaxID=658473 RepID=A0A8H6VZG0_MYCCL|nr:hypothetical protein HMN09_00995100 [Mycena chlorophos]
MHELLLARLRASFPSLFQYQSDEDLEWSVMSGWYSILYRLCLALSTNPDAQFFQIKEKFSGLKAYFANAKGKDREHQSMMQNESYLVCELCGEEGRLATSGYWHTFCQECVDTWRANGRELAWKERPEGLWQ